MPDLEKVKKGLEICIDREPGKYVCNECPYEIDGNWCEINLAKDALILLKDREPVPPEKQNDGEPEAWASWWYVCGKCKKPIDYGDSFCRHCGREVKWVEG
jgi:hypothetical protein